MNHYDDEQNVKNYLRFLGSHDGQIQQRILTEAILQRLRNEQPQLNMLDAGCGSGWLTAAMQQKFAYTQGCDSSSLLLQKAQIKYPNITFTEANLSKALPYPEQQFDIVILNMVATDLDNQTASLQNLYQVTKPGGKLIITIPNPYYSYPVGIWKRGFPFILKKPELKLRPYNFYKKEDRSATSKKQFTSNFYTLEETLNNILKAHYQLAHFQELSVPADDAQFSLQYQLYRFPLILLLEFVRQNG